MIEILHYIILHFRLYFGLQLDLIGIALFAIVCFSLGEIFVMKVKEIYKAFMICYVKVMTWLDPKHSNRNQQ